MASKNALTWLTLIINDPASSLRSCLPTFWQNVFTLLFVYRYTRLVGNAISHWCYKSKPIPLKSTFSSKDATVVIPTIHNAFEELRPSLTSILACDPYELILVTTADKVCALEKLAHSLRRECQFPNIKVLHTHIANKRVQVCEALPQVKTPITIMADDDVTWPSTLITWTLAPFEDPKIGGVGTKQRVRRVRSGPLAAQIWNWLGAAYIERRNFEITATHNIDGGTSCMSGRTGAYRSEILQSHDFLESFQTERWGNYTINADDDNFLTRWLVNHQWATWIQYEPECELETTLENDVKFLYQCLRWSRSNWRSNWTSLVHDRYVLTQQPWCTYAVHMATFTSLTFVVEPLLLYLCWRATEDWDPFHQKNAFWGLVLWMLSTKVVKLMGLFMRDPRDILFLPMSIIFGYFHGLIKLYALCTLHVTSWGSRVDGDANDNLRLTPRPRRSASLSTPPSQQTGLIQYTREHYSTTIVTTRLTEKVVDWNDESTNEKTKLLREELSADS